MRDFDRFAVEKLRIPAIVLMENAAASAVSIISRNHPHLAGMLCTVFCGKGNNGGDGLAISRHLVNRGVRVQVVLTGKKRELKGEARTNLDSLVRLQKALKNKSMLRILELKSSRSLAMLPAPDLVIDAIFGTGFTGLVKGHAKESIEWMNRFEGTTISIDVPSGLGADDGDLGGVAVEADSTITMSLRKVGLYSGLGKGYAGSIEVADIGFQPRVVRPWSPNTFLVEQEDVLAAIPARPFNAHKHSVGKIFVLAGSRGLTGAAFMTASAAMRVGAGTVILGTPSSVYPILARKLNEVMVEPLPETSDGSLSLAASDGILKHAAWADVVIIGPGLSRNPETERVIRRTAGKIRKPILLDADGLNAFSGRFSLLKRRKNRQMILTPHTGELVRLTGFHAKEIERKRVALSRNVAKSLGLTLVLKGSPTVTASEDGLVFVNSSGNPGMATAGSGDVLSGIIGGLWAQGMERTRAAVCGVFVHGKAGDLARDELGEKGMMATDIIRKLPAVLR